MKAKLSYKSKRNIVISVIIVALLAVIGTGTYFFTKGNDDAQAFTQNNMQIGEVGQTEAQENEGQEAQHPEENQNQGENEGTQNPVENNNAEETTNEGGNNPSNQGTTAQGQNGGTTGTTTGEVPNEEYVTERVEEQEVLVSEDYAVEWAPLSMQATTTTSNLSIIRPILSAEKIADKTAVRAGETITYTITVSNTGTADGIALVKDSIPTGTTFVAESIKINGEATKNENGEALTQTDLANGIEVNVEKQNEEGIAGTAEITFQVTVNKDVEGVILNVANINGEETNETKNPVITFEKKASATEIEAGDVLTYTIEIKNSGEVAGTATIKDNIPEGTTFVEGSIKVNGTDTNKTAEDLSNGIEVAVEGGEKATLTFDVTINDLEDGTKIKNTATVNDGPTNETETEYQKPVISQEKTANKTAVVEGEELEYTITVTNDGKADGTALVKDTVPDGTTFKAGSIKVNGTDTNKTAEDLANGIEVAVAKNGGKATVSFVVTVNKGTTGTLSNKANVNGNETEEVKNPVITFEKKASATEIEAGDVLTYTIEIKNSGEVAGTATIKDNIPEGTTFVEGSIKVDGTDTDKTAEDLANGIEVAVEGGEKVTLTFDVTINDLEDGTKIKNTATVNDGPTNETETEYQEPVISQEKTANKTAVVEGEELTYTIAVTNDGKADGTALVKDTVPDGTTFKAGSIKVNGTDTNKTAEDLANGIEVAVAKNGGKATVSFVVTVNKGTTGTLSNKANVNGNETEEVKNPVITFEKKASATEIEAGDVLTYTIEIKNSGEVAGTATIKDNIPEGTTFVEGSIKVDGTDTDKTAEDLANGIEVAVEGGEKVTLTFDVTINDLEDGTKIKNTATVNDGPTNETETEYQEPVISQEKTANKTAVVEGEELTYTIAVTNDGKADGTALVKDTVPDGTKFKAGSIKVNGTDTNKTAEDLANGIEVAVAKNGGKATVSFVVTVNKGTTGTLSNKANVNGNETEEVKNPVITFNKAVDKSEAKVGDTLTYTITATNSGKVAGIITIRDTKPAGTTFVENSLTINDQNANYENDEEALSTGISYELQSGKTVTLTFQVTVNENVTGTLVNIAYVNDKPTDGKETKIESNIIFVENGGTEVEDMNGYTGEVIANKNMPTTTKTGYIFAGWYAEETLKNVVETLPAKYPAGTTYYYAKWEADTNTKYTVEYYYQQTDGTYPTEADNKDENRTGTTGAPVTIKETDKTPTQKGYVFAEGYKENVLEGTIAPDGSTVLKVYFKKQYTVTYKPGTQGTFTEIVKENLDYGVGRPEYDGPQDAEGNPTGNIGYTFAGWTPELIDTVTDNLEYVAQWTANKCNYTVEYWYESKDDAEEPWWNDTGKTEGPIIVNYGDVITTYPTEGKDNKGAYIFDHVIPEDKVDKTKAALTITENENTNVIKVYYIRNSFDYKIEYYKDSTDTNNGGTKLAETETAKAKIGTAMTEERVSADFGKDWINAYKPEIGYKDGDVSYITIEKENNVIKVCYVIDPEQKKPLSYTVEYYKNEEKADTDTVTKQIQVLQNTLPVDKDKINTTDKYYGYKCVTDPATIPDTIVNGGVIKVYYVIDEDETKSLSYTVEYYKDDVKVDTDTVTKQVQVLQNTLPVDKDAINITDKYPEYVFDRTNPTTIPNTIDDGGIIKVYYNSLYTVTYYGPTDDGQYSETVNKQVDQYKDIEKKTDHTIINYTGINPTASDVTEGYVFAGSWTTNKKDIFITKADTTRKGYAVGSTINVTSNVELYAQFITIEATKTEAKSFWNNKTTQWSDVTRQLTPVLINGKVENQVFYTKETIYDKDAKEYYVLIKSNGGITSITDDKGKSIDIYSIRLVVGHTYTFNVDKNDVPGGIVTVTVK